MGLFPMMYLSGFPFDKLWECYYKQQMMAQTTQSCFGGFIHVTSWLRTSPLLRGEVFVGRDAKNKPPTLSLSKQIPSSSRSSFRPKMKISTAYGRSLGIFRLDLQLKGRLEDRRIWGAIGPVRAYESGYSHYHTKKLVTRRKNEAP